MDDHTIHASTSRNRPPFWADAFVGVYGMIIPRHLFEAYKARKVARRRRQTWSRSAPAHTCTVDFKPGDLVQGKLNPSYHMPNRPSFDTIEMKGGGDALSDARAVLQTGECDFAWNMQVEDEILKRLEGEVARDMSKSCQAAASSTFSSTTPIRGTMWMASARASSRSTHTGRSSRCARRSTCWWIAPRCTSPSI